MRFRYVKQYKQPTILILDSGVGGLFVYNVVRNVFPYANYLYCFDNRFFPYGELSESFIIQRIIFIIEMIFIRCQYDLVIIACNTISVISLNALKARFKFPIIGMLPEIKLATKYTKNGVIGILATYRTINSGYVLKITKNYSYKYNLILLDAPELVILAEYKMHGNLILKSDLRMIFEPWFLLKKFPDTFVLGCTHFSWLKKELIEILPINSYLIDSEYFCNSYVQFFLNNYFQVNNHMCYQKLCQYNIAYCTRNTANIYLLKTILLFQYDFSSLEVLSI